MSKKLLSIFLSLCMVLSLATVPALAADEETGICYVETDGVKTYYDTLQGAVDAIGNGSGTIVLVDDCTGAGVKVSQGTVVFDLNGNTYTATDPTVGSTNTSTQAFQLLRGSTVTFKNGTIAVSEDAENCKRIIQNYSTLTLEGVVLDGTNLVEPTTGAAAVMACANGTVSINDSAIVAADGWTALNIGTFGSYTSVEVTLGEGCAIESVVIDSETSSTLKVGENEYNDVTSYNIKEGTVYTGTTLKDATCTTTGVIKYSDGTDTWYEVIPAGHLWELETVTSDATCGADGEGTRACTRCDATEDIVLPATGLHTWGTTETTVEATCTEPSKVCFSCSTCGANSEGTVVNGSEALGHEWALDTDNAGYVAATCTDGGLNVYKCTREGCAETMTEETEDLGHEWNYEKTNIVDDCENGQVANTPCNNCDAVLSEETGLVPGGGEHAWNDGKVTTEATCTEAGEKVFTCETCSATKTEVVPAVGHTPVSADNGTAATCLAAGKEADTVCSVCNATLEEGAEIPVDANAHVAVQTILKGASCNSAGVAKETCSLCNASMGYVSIPADHSWGEPETVEATCGADGSKTYTCTVDGCDGNKTEVIEATGEHTWGDMPEVVDATCTEPSMVYNVCSTCGANSEGTVVNGSEALGHEWALDTDAADYVAATCTLNGVNVYKCTREGCKETMTEETEALGHEWDYKNTKIVDDCENGQVAITQCTRCDAVRSEETGLAPGGGEHAWDEGAVTTEATCTEAGEKFFTCETCGATKTEVVPAAGHTPVSADNGEAATCQAAGKEADTVCSVCEETLKKGAEIPVDENAHVAAQKILKNAECNSAGVAKETCSLCGASMGYVSIPADHTWGAPVVVEATCGTAGSKTYTCTVDGCDGNKTEVIEATGEHDWENATTIVIDANCTEPAKVYVACPTCGVYSSSEGAVVNGTVALGHEWALDTDAADYVAATCTKGGLNVYKCTREGCEETMTEETAALGHEWDEGVLADADCEHGSHVLYTCETCNETYVEETGIDEALGHKYEDVTVEATCAAAAKRYKECTVCGDIIDEETIGEPDANAHVWDEDTMTVLRRASCTAAGVARATCSLCETTKYISIAVEEHTWNDGEVTTDPTCTADGVATYTCAVCDGTYDEVIPATGHTYGDETVDENNTCVYQICSVCGDKLIVEILDKDNFDCEHVWGEGVVTDPTCTEAGFTTYTCAICEGEKVEDEVEALGHTEETVAGQATTCTEAGLTDGVKCAVCGETLVEQEVIEALGHTAGATVKENVVGATCTGAGSYDAVVYCSVCDAELSRETVESDVLGHTEVVDEAVDATCTTSGLTEGKHCSVCGEILVAQEVVEALGHAEEPVAGKAATCTETGLTDGVKCSVCGETLVEQEVIEALGHTAGATVKENVVGATCTGAGSYDAVVYCSVCDAELSRETVESDVLGHTEVVDETVDATCTTSGLTEGKHCSVCGEILVAQEVVEALGHAEETVAGKAATCTEAGLTDGVKCSVCGETLVEQEVIEALGHDYVDGFCSVCGDKDPDYVDVHTHGKTLIATSYNDDWTKVTYTFKCDICGETWTETVDM